MRRVFFFSFFLNLLVLTTPIFMIIVFDRVLSSGSLSTLVYLALIAMLALLIYGTLDMVRGRVLTIFSAWMDDQLSDHLLETSIRAGLAGRPLGAQPLRELATIRSFVGSNMISSLCDAVWVPLFLFAIYLLHPLLFWVALAGAVLLFSLGYVNDVWTRPPSREAGQVSARAQTAADAALRNGEVVQAMGMMPGLLYRWRTDNREALGYHVTAGERSANIMGLGKFFRLAVQVGILALGAALVINPDVHFTAGAMIAASILLGRALAPVEQALGGWRGLTGALEAANRLRALMIALPAPEDTMTLPAPKGILSVERLTWLPRGSGKPILRNVSFDVRSGEAVGIVGPSAAGKSTLCRLIVGLHPPTQGHARLDGAETWSWQRSDFGKYVGYMPQDVEIFPGTVWENIARLDPNADPADVVAAAKMAGVETMIRALPQGYDTIIGEGGMPLSGGQRQRIALARVCYRRPKLVVLDEPNANLDREGEQALENAIASLKAAGAAIVLVAHKPNILMQTERVLVLREGVAEIFDERDAVLTRLAGPRFLEAARAEVSSEFTSATAPASPSRPAPKAAPKAESQPKVQPAPPPPKAEAKTKETHAEDKPGAVHILRRRAGAPTEAKTAFDTRPSPQQTPPSQDPGMPLSLSATIQYAAKTRPTVAASPQKPPPPPAAPPGKATAQAGSAPKGQHALDALFSDEDE